MKTATMIQVGVVGAGANTRFHHIPKLQAIPGVRVVGVCNRTRSSGNRVADEFGIPQVYPTWAAVIEDDAVDAVVIGTWPNLHCPITVASLERGKHVLCEARMAMDATEAHRMLDASLAYPELIAQVVPSPFTLRFDRTLKRLVDEQVIGRLLAVDIHACTGAFVDREAPMTWRQDIGLSGMNTLTLGIWYEAMARWLGHTTRVQARGRAVFGPRTDADGNLRAMDIPDHLDVLTELASGVPVHIRASEVMGHCPDPWTVVLYGEDGTLKLDAGTDRLLMIQRGERVFSEVVIPDHEAQGWRVEEEFIGAIRGEEVIRLTSFEEGVRYMEFTEAVHRSCQEGCEIRLPLGSQNETRRD